jgi:hypothetical protein
MLTPIERISAGALIGSAAGFFGMFVFTMLTHPGSNLVGLGAFLIGAPLGAIAGAMIGDRGNKALMILWVLTLLVTLSFSIGPRLMVAPIVVQLLFVFAAFRFRTELKWALVPIFILTAVISLFPPVTGGFASIFDSRLDASRHVPELTVRRRLLATELGIAVLIAIVIVRSVHENESAAESAALDGEP